MLQDYYKKRRWSGCFQTAKSALLLFSIHTTRSSKNIYRRLLCSFSHAPRRDLEITSRGNVLSLSLFLARRFARMRLRPWPHMHAGNAIALSRHRCRLTLSRGIKGRDHLHNAQAITRNAHARMSRVCAQLLLHLSERGCRTCQLATSS